MILYEVPQLEVTQYFSQLFTFIVKQLVLVVFWIGKCTLSHSGFLSAGCVVAYRKVLQEKQAGNPPILLELYILTLADIQTKLSPNLPLKLGQESCKAGVWECSREEAPFTLMNRQEISTKTNKRIKGLRFLLEWESSHYNLGSAGGRKRPDILAGCCGGESMLDGEKGSMATNWCPLLSRASQLAIYPLYLCVWL